VKLELEQNIFEKNIFDKKKTRIKDSPKVLTSN